MTVASTEVDKPFVKIVFDGVVAVGPGRPATGQQKGPFFAVMASSSRRLSDRTQRLAREREAAAAAGVALETKPEENYYVHMHVPTIFTRLEPAKDSRPPDQILQLSPFHERWYIWHPIRERLEFRPDDDGEPDCLDYPDGSSSMGFSTPRGHYLNEKELSFHPIKHVPDLREIWPDRDELCEGMLSSRTPVDQRVMTQVLVPRGTVVGAGVLEQGKPLKVAFEPARNCKELDAVPSAAVVVRANTIRIASYSLDSGKPLDSIELDARDGGEIWVSNGDPSDVEIDMKRLSIEILKRLIGSKNWKLPPDFRSYFPRLPRLFVKILNGFSGMLARKFVNIFADFYHHHQHHQHELLRSLHRTGDFDLDFELFYTLMKNEGATKNGGLPVPKRASSGTGGPDCYNCVCRTRDSLAFVSKSKSESQSTS